MSKLSDTYAAAMVAGNSGVCFEIERAQGLDGFPPELVGVGLQALEAGKDPYKAIEIYMSPRDDKTADLFAGQQGDVS